MVLLAIVWLHVPIAFGQKVKVTSGEAEVIQYPNMTYDEACKAAWQEAVISAIQKEFPTNVDRESRLSVKDDQSHFYFVGNVKVRGQWIKDLEEPKFTPFNKDGVTSVKCRVKGLVREAVSRPKLEFEVLNHPNVASRTTEFYNYEDLYVYFKSPIKGYLSIYLEESDSVSRLLPYQKMKDDLVNGVPIEGDKDYLFFDPKRSTFKDIPVDEIFLFTNRTQTPDYNTLYILFSENPYHKPILYPGGTEQGFQMPSKLPSRKFREWLEECRTIDTQFQDIPIVITINPEKR